MNIATGYLVGSLMLGLAYLLLYWQRKDLRREMLFGSLIAVPYALTAPFFIPEYWDPPYLLGFGQLGLGVEDFLFCYFVGGIAAVMYEVVLKRTEVRIARKRRKGEVRWWPYLVGTGVFLILEYYLPAWSVLSLAGALLIVAVIVVDLRRDLLPQALIAGVSFALLYYMLFGIFRAIYPSYIEVVYQHQNLLGIYIFGLPLEEILFAFSIGMAWSVGYEYILGYRTRKKRK